MQVVSKSVVRTSFLNQRILHRSKFMQDNQADHKRGWLALNTQDWSGAMSGQLGVVTEGSFNDGLTVRLDAGCSTEAIQVGNFVVVEGEGTRYFSTIAD